MSRIVWLALALLLIPASGIGFAGGQDKDADGPILPKALIKLRSYEKAAEGDQPALIFIYSDTCEICRKTAPGVWTAAQKYSKKMGFVMYEVNKANKPDPEVKNRFGDEAHHRTIVDHLEIRLMEELDRRFGRGRGGGDGKDEEEDKGPIRTISLEIKEEKAYALYVRDIENAYRGFIEMRVNDALEWWRRRQEYTGRSGGGRGGRGGRGGDGGTTGDPAADMVNQPFKNIKDPYAVMPILEGIAGVKTIPTEPLNVARKISGLKFSINSKQWAGRREEFTAKWKEEWKTKLAAMESSEAHATVRSRIKALGDKHPVVRSSATQELMRLTGMDFIYDHLGSKDERKRGQKVWKAWYQKAKKNLKWDFKKKTFATPE